MTVAGSAVFEAALRTKTDVVAFAAAWQVREADVGVDVDKGSLDVGAAVMATSLLIYW